MEIDPYAPHLFYCPATCVGWTKGPVFQHVRRGSLVKNGVSARLMDICIADFTVGVNM